MVTVQQAFAQQLETTIPITQDQIDAMVRSRVDCVTEWNWEEDGLPTALQERILAGEFSGVVPGVSKKLFYLSEETLTGDDFLDLTGPTPTITKSRATVNILSCWDHEIEQVAQTHTISPSADVLGCSHSMPRLTKIVLNLFDDAERLRGNR